jgi:hypothetical protein
MVNPKRCITPKLVINDVGIEMAVMIVLRTLKRKMNMTTAARSPPIKTSSVTPKMASSINWEVSDER